LNYGDGDYEYVVDDQEKPTVFLPAAYAQTHIQCVSVEQMHVVVMLNDELQEIAIPRSAGLIVKDDDVSDLLTNRLTNYRDWGEKKLKGFPVYIYLFPEEGEVGHAMDNVETEIYWRYVGDVLICAFFNSRQELVNDVKFRKEVIKAAREPIEFTFGSPYEKVPGRDKYVAMFNESYWASATTVKGGVLAYDALADYFIHGSRYRTMCGPANEVVMYRGLCRTSILGEEMPVRKAALQALVGSKPFTTKDNPSKVFVAYANPHRHSWIPGDGGYIWNNNGTTNADAGENLIYLGGDRVGGVDKGCFEKEEASFMDAGKFWGLVPEEYKPFEKTLNQWLTVAFWGQDPDVFVTRQRTYLKQPIGQ